MLRLAKSIYYHQTCLTKKPALLALPTKSEKNQASSTIGFGASIYKLIAQELLNVRLSSRTFVCSKHNWTIVKSEIS